MADLKGALALQARDAGVREIEVLPHCTFADPDLFFSHRRDRGVTGRMAAIISPRA
jgi:copper oxidase (laccase) domain-containing protein